MAMAIKSKKTKNKDTFNKFGVTMVIPNFSDMLTNQGWGVDHAYHLDLVTPKKI